MVLNPAAGFNPPLLAESRFYRYLERMNWLTRQEQLVLCAVIGLLLTGLLVKYYRAVHPPEMPVLSATP